jgi:tetratricopeptide (TPR) repeat protein
VLLAWRLLQRWLGDGRWAVAGALLFAVHPMHVESVTFVSGRTDLVAGVFILAAAVLHSRRGAAREWLAIAGIAACGLAAPLSKEIGLLLVPLLLAIDRWHHRLTPKRILAERWPIYAALAVVTIGYLLWRRSALGFWLFPPAAHSLAIDRRFLVPYTLARYLELTFVPFQHNPFFNLADWSPGFTPAFMASLAVLAGFAAMFFVLRREPSLPLGLAVWGLFLLPVFNLWSIGANYLAERFLFLPVLGGCLVIVVLVRRARGRWLGWLAVGILAASWAVGVSLRNPVWRDNESLFTQVLRESPHAAMAHHNLGILLTRSGRQREALDHYLSAIDLDSTYVSAYNGAGSAWLELHRPDSAAVVLEKGLRFQPRSRELRTNLGWAYVETGRAAEAARVLEAVCAEDPTAINARLNLLESYLALGRVADASSVASDLLRLDPRNARVRLALGNVDLRAGRLEQASAAYREARILDPASPLPLAALISAYSNPARPDSMILYSRELIRLDETSANGWNGLGAGLLLQGQYRPAIEALLRARALMPDDFSAFSNLLIAYQRSGQIEAARQCQSDWIRRFPHHPRTAEVMGYRF